MKAFIIITADDLFHIFNLAQGLGNSGLCLDRLLKSIVRREM